MSRKKLRRQPEAAKQTQTKREKSRAELSSEKDSVEAVLFVADVIDPVRQEHYTRETLRDEILPLVKATKRCLDAWMEGDKLVARLTPPA